MPTAIKLRVEQVQLTGHLNDNPAGRAIAAAMPLRWSGSRWGEEYYGNLDKDLGPVEGQVQTVMAVGDLAFHSPTGWFCLFFGPTPASSGAEPVAAAAVIKVGEMKGDWEAVSALGGSVRGVLAD